MIRVDCVQGTTEWASARLGKVTASQMSRIITPGGKLSSQADGYMHQLIAEELLGVPLDEATSGFMERGTVLEQKAVSWYELQRDETIDRVGFVMRDDRRVGCSPDGLVGERGGAEIKCPSAAVHVGYLIGDVGDKYKTQMQTCLWICERDWWDFLSFNPALPSAIVRVHRDEAYIKTLAKLVDQFLSFVDESKEKLMKRGIIPQADVAPILYGKPVLVEPSAEPSPNAAATLMADIELLLTDDAIPDKLADQVREELPKKASDLKWLAEQKKGLGRLIRLAKPRGVTA